MHQLNIDFLKLLLPQIFKYMCIVRAYKHARTCMRIRTLQEYKNSPSNVILRIMQTNKAAFQLAFFVRAYTHEKV